MSKLSWYDESHGILDVIIDKWVESDGQVLDRNLWKELEKVLDFLHTMWQYDQRNDAYVLNHSVKWVTSFKTPREFNHKQLDELIRNSLTDIITGYQQGSHASWIVNNGAELRKGISFTTPEEYNLEGEWAKSWNAETQDESVEDDATVNAMSFMRPDSSGNRGGNPAASKTMSRSGAYPYDRPITYGRVSTWDNNAAGGVGDLTRPKNAWESLELSLDEDLDAGEMGEGGLAPDELELDFLKNAFRQQFDRTLPAAQGMDSPSLFVLLSDIDPDFMAQTFAPDDDSEMAELYAQWGLHVAGPEER